MLIEFRPKSKTLIEIFVDEELWNTVHTSLFGNKLPLLEKCSTLEELQTLFATLEKKAAKDNTLYHLGRQSLSEGQVRQKLVRRQVSAAAIEEVILDCRRLGYLNDLQWAQGVVRKEKRISGPYLIAQKLKFKGASEPLIKKVLEETQAVSSQEEDIRRLIEGRYRSKDLTNLREKQKVMASLQRRGFSFESICRALKHVHDDHAHDSIQ